MASARKGVFIQGLLHPEAEAALNGQLGEKNMAPRSFGVGSGGHLSNVGAHNACWSLVDLSNVGDLANVPVPHNLNEVPVHVELASVSNTKSPATVILMGSVDQSKWTASECRVQVIVNQGSATGCLARFRVWGS